VIWVQETRKNPYDFALKMQERGGFFLRLLGKIAYDAAQLIARHPSVDYQQQKPPAP
jgi:hypothetical protein